MEHQLREAEEPRVILHHHAAEPEAEREAEHRAGTHHGQGEFPIVPGDRPIGVAERLQCRDLLALRPHQPPQHRVQQKHRDGEEYGRHGRRHHTLLGDLVGEEPVRGWSRRPWAIRPP